MKKFTDTMTYGAGLVMAFSSLSANAFEPGYPGWNIPPGVLIGATAAAPPPGLYSFNQLYSIQATLTGPGGQANTKVHLASAAFGLTWSPGWDVLGGKYTTTIVQPFTVANVGAPFNTHRSGIHNTYIAPGAISWNLGAGWFAKAGLGIAIPDGTIQGESGLENVGNPWWTFHPDLVVSYLKDGWNLTANLSEEFNTESYKTGYRTGNILHLDLTTTKTIGKWTIGPIATYVGQVTGDSSSRFYNNRVITDHFNVISVGPLIGYNFGPATLNLWGTKDINTNASGGLNPDRATIPRGYKVYASVNFKVF
ncbi:transporter [Pseudomonas sp. FEN]|uniref:SphA family protein n=1 Tax=Pseudomonas sp. FEN TaxID=2767468 RepID=UPI00174AA638|nr:transporter [Pseudomonas sp. FEN]CAD5198495.1 hypothetical protein [Pseudomonas sp. FEN]